MIEIMIEKNSPQDPELASLVQNRAFAPILDALYLLIQNYTQSSYWKYQKISKNFRIQGFQLRTGWEFSKWNSMITLLDEGEWK